MNIKTFMVAAVAALTLAACAAEKEEQVAVDEAAAEATPAAEETPEAAVDENIAQ